MKCIRSSERKVREDFYKSVANLCGGGLSLKEVSTAVIEVENGVLEGCGRTLRTQRKVMMMIHCQPLGASE